MSGVKTHIQRQIQTQNITLPQQRLKINKLSLTLPLQILRQPRPVIIPNPHPKCQRLLGHVPPDAAHTQDAEYLTLGIVAERRRWVSPPGTSAQGRHGAGKVAQGAEHEPDVEVGCGVVDGGGGVGDEDGAVCTGGDVD